MEELIPFIIAVCVSIAIASAQLKNKKKTPGRQSPRQDRESNEAANAPEKVRAFWEEVAAATIPRPGTESNPESASDWSEEEDLPSGSMPDDSPEGTACDIPHSNTDPRLGDSPVQEAVAPPPARKQTPAPRYTAKTMRSAVIASEILSPPKALRARRFPR